MKTQEEVIEFVQKGFRHECGRTRSKLIAQILVRGDRPDLEEKIYAEIERVNTLRFRHCGLPETSPGELASLYKQSIRVMRGDEQVEGFYKRVEEFEKQFDKTKLPTEEVLEKFPCDFSFLGVECDS